MNFGAPNWLWALAFLPLLVLLYARAERRSAIKLREFVSPRLLPQLAGNVNRVRRAIRFAFVLFALALATIALAKPRWGYTYEDVKRRGLDLLFAVDTSRSMLSNDVAPNRLERVKLAAQDLITELQGDRAGLIAFAGRAFLQAPLTIDYDAAVESINDLDTKTIPEGGTNISEAIALATQTFGKSAMGNRALIIFTDGEELSGDAVSEAKKAADAGVKIFTIGVGTAQGSLIPVEGNGEPGFVKDAKGQVVKSKLDENRLREIAQATGGIYLHLESGPQTMRQLYAAGLSKLKTAEIDARLSSRPIERYEWPLAGAIVALIASLFINDRKRAQTPRRSPVKREVLVAASLLFVAAAEVNAVSGIDLYNTGRYEDAYAQFQKDLQDNINPADMPKMQFDAGAAAYKLRNYDKALEAFSQSLVDRSPRLQEKSRYNLGRTLEDRADFGKTNEETLKDLENAAQHYEQALKLDPQDKAAAERLEIVRKKIEKLKQHPKQPPPPPQKNQQNKKDQKKDEQQQQQQQQQSQDEQQQNQDQNQDQQKQDQQQAKNNQRQPTQQNQEQNPENQKNQQNSDKRDKQPSPSPSPGREQKQPGQKKKDQRGAGESPTPSPGEDSSPSPSPGESGENPTPSPSPGENSGKGENASPSATPSASPTKPRSGEIKGAGEPSDEQQKEDAAEAEAMERGEMSPQQAARLLQAMKDEEARVQLDERKPVHRVYNDW
ncbi:MAG TPA: VWA domain-containing protein [Chthoniobacterales bacterium]|jgi:Ca-activated chloride channel family protein|nr:VWA domain-containing protein [Chthoniobacterales bacterium]